MNRDECLTSLVSLEGKSLRNQHNIVVPMHLLIQFVIESEENKKEEKLKMDEEEK